MTDRVVLEVDGLTVRYATRAGEITAVNDVGFRVREGSSLALVGESGSGKSTVALTLLDLLGEEATVAAGRLVFQGQDLLTLPHVERVRIRGDRISVVFQDPFTSLNPALDIGLQVAEPLMEHKGLARGPAHEAAVGLLSEVGIPRPREVAGSYPHQLSGGMQQRALIAAALACEPELLILDEPTTALDVTIEAQILDLLEGIREQHRLSILFITHNLGVVNRFCDDLCVLYAGQVQEVGPTREVLSAPLHPYTRGMLGSIPRLTTGGVNRLVSIPGRLPDLAELPEGCVFHPRCPHAEQRCRDEPQQFVAGARGREVRCWKADMLPALGAPDEVPASALEARERDRQPNAWLVEVSDLRKEFRTGRATLVPRLVRDGRSWPRLRFDAPRVHAVDGLDLEIAPGQVLGLVGESGSGKSTLGRCIVRLMEPTAGSIVVAGQEVARLDESRLAGLRRCAQIIFQNPDSSLNPRKDVERIVGRPLALLGEVPAADRRDRILELLDMVGLPAAYLSRYPHQLSGGEKQRVGIARALAFSPSFIVCDEPVSALDVSVQATILNLLADLRDRLDLSYLFISHDISVVAHICGRIAVMYAGVVCEQGPTRELLSPPYHPYTESLLSAIPLVGEGSDERSRIRLREDVEGIRDVQAGCKFHRRCPRKLGPVCEQERPPLVEVGAGHRIACHIPTAELANVPSAIPVR